MENEEKLSAPRAVFGLKKKISSTGNLGSDGRFSRPNLKLSIPQKSESFRQLPTKVPKSSRNEKSRFAFDHEIEKDFEELSVKQEIFGILRSDSTFCESPFHRESLPNKMASNMVNFFDQIESELDKSIEIVESVEAEKETANEEYFFADFKKENLYSVYKKCKKE